MKNHKNYIIALLTGLLALSLFTQPAQSAAKSKEAKAMEYLMCLQLHAENWLQLDGAIGQCVKYRP